MELKIKSYLIFGAIGCLLSVLSLTFSFVAAAQNRLNIERKEGSDLQSKSLERRNEERKFYEKQIRRKQQ
ncbi:MAG: hypothetical protein ABI686_08760 [Acidobacteriota bacterium]